MIISPPFLPDRATLTEEAWLDAAMAQPLSRLASTGAPEGSFPLSLKLAWHNGLHIQAPQVGGTYLPVRAIADGEVVFVHAPTEPNADVAHALNYNPFNDGTPNPTWTSDGFVVIRHTTEIGATGNTPTEVTYFSAYMHLSHVANCPKSNAQWEAGDAIYRKDELGAPGQIYGHGGQIHFEICCDEAHLRQFVPRAPAWTDPLTPTVPTANGRTDSVFGSMYVYLPAGTPTSTTAPTSHLHTGGPVAGSSAATDHFVPNTLHAAQWAEIRYQQGNGTVTSYRATDGAGGLKVGEPIGQSHSEPDFEYNLYTEATKRHNSLDAATQALSSPSGWYELLRFGRNLGPDPLPNHAAHWREIPTATGTVWADLNGPGTFKFSDADFPAFRGWNCFDDDLSPTDQRCDSLHLKTLIRNPDPTDDRRMEREQLALRLGEPMVRAKLRRAICRFPSEWDQRTVVERYSWLLTDDFKPADDDSTGSQKWERFVSHARAISFTNLPADFLKADWRFHPREFVGVMRTCGWLSRKESQHAFPNAKLENINRFSLDLNKLSRKYLGHSMCRRSHFIGQMAHESGQLGRALLEGGNTKGSRNFEDLGDYYRGPDNYFNQYENNISLGNVSPGDGIKFRGRGAIQLTGLYNYVQYWVYRGWITKNTFDDPWWDKAGRRIPKINDPQRVSARQGNDQYDTLDSSLSYWVRRSINRPADAGMNQNDIELVTLRINSAGLHLHERVVQSTATYRYLGDDA